MKLANSLILKQSNCKIVGIPVITEPLTCPEKRQTQTQAIISNNIHSSFPVNRIKNSRYFLLTSQSPTHNTFKCGKTKSRLLSKIVRCLVIFLEQNYIRRLLKIPHKRFLELTEYKLTLEYRVEANVLHIYHPNFAPNMKLNGTQP